MSAAGMPQQPPAHEPDPLASTFEMRSAPVDWRRVWGTALTTSLGYVLGVATGHLEWGAWAFFGGFTSFYVAGQPYRRRAKVLGAAVVGLAAAMFLGGFSRAWWVTAPVLGAVSVSATYITGRFRIALPAGLMFILVACLSAALPPGHLAMKVLFVLVGGLIAWLVGMSGWPFRPDAPEAAQVRDAFRSVAAYLGHWSDEHTLRFQNRAAKAVAAAAAAAADGTRRDVRRGQTLAMLARQAEDILLGAIALASETPTPLSPAARRDVARLGDRDHPQALGGGDRPKAAALRGELTRLAQSPLGGHFQRVVEGMARPAPVVLAAHAPSAAPPVLRPSPLVPFSALRVGLAVTFSVVLAGLLGLSHPYWVPLTCAAVLQGETVLMLTRRAIQRVAGTVGGLLLAGALIAGLHVGPMVSLALVVVLQALMLVVIAKNYALAVACVTAFAFLILNVSSPSPAVPLVLARLRDTLLGVGIAVAATYLLWPRKSSKRLPAAVSALIADVERLFVGLAEHQSAGGRAKEVDGVPGAGRRRTRPEASPALRVEEAAEVQGEILRADDLAADAQDELPAARAVEPLLPVLHAAERLGYLLLAANAAGVDLQAGEVATAQARAVFRSAVKRVRGEHPPEDAPAARDIWTPAARELQTLARR